MEQKRPHGLGKVGEEIVAFPIVRPREIEKESTHLQAKYDQNHTKRLVH
jgi:hypothetical protein